MSNNLSNVVLAFDVYGTLIDPLHIEEQLRPAFGDRAKEASELWRGKQVEYSFRRALMKKYRDFDVCTEQALRFVCRQLNVPLTDDRLHELLAHYLKLPAYPDVPDALANLAARGYKLVACSNGTENSIQGLLRHAGVLPHFGGIVSVDRIHTFKPDPAVYEYLVREVSASKEKIWMVSSNPFDVIGAKACGLRTAWVRRDAKRVFDPWEFEPDLTIPGLHELADSLSHA